MPYTRPDPFDALDLLEGRISPRRAAYLAQAPALIQHAAAATSGAPSAPFVLPILRILRNTCAHCGAQSHFISGVYIRTYEFANAADAGIPDRQKKLALKGHWDCLPGVTVTIEKGRLKAEKGARLDPMQREYIETQSECCCECCADAAGA